MKKTKTLLLVLCSILFLTAAPFAQALTPKPFKAVLFFDIGGIKDSGFSRSAYQGMEKAVARLGVQAVYVENARPLELDRALSQAAASDAGMIIGVGFAFSEKFNQLAVRHPEKKFVCVDYSIKDGKERA